MRKKKLLFPKVSTITTVSYSQKRGGGQEGDDWDSVSKPFSWKRSGMTWGMVQQKGEKAPDINDESEPFRIFHLPNGGKCISSLVWGRRGGGGKRADWYYVGLIPMYFLDSRLGECKSTS